MAATVKDNKQFVDGENTRKTALTANGTKEGMSPSVMGGNKEEKLMIAPAGGVGGKAVRGGTSISLDEFVDDRNYEEPPKSFSPKCCFISLVAQLVLVSLTASFLFGFNVAALNTSKSFIILEFQWCGAHGTVSDLLGCTKAKTYGTLINGGVFVGATVGAITGGMFLSYGRRFCLMLTHILFIWGDLMSIASDGFWSLLLARLAVGVGVGFSSVIVGVWVAENTPRQSRGFWGVFIQLAITVGILVANLLGLAFGTLDQNAVDFYPSEFQRAWWRVMLGIGIVPAGIGLLLTALVYKYDTPHFLLEEGREKVAKALIATIYSKDNVEDVNEEFEDTRNAVKEMKIVERHSLSMYEAMKNKHYRYVILIGCFLSAGQQFTGINVMISNSNLLYKTAGVSDDLMTIISVVLTLVNMLMTFPPVFLIDRIGRKTLLVIGTVGQTLCLLPGMIASWIDSSSKAVGWISIASTYGYIIFFAMAYGPVLWVYLFEIFPIEIKKRATGLAVACNWLASIVMVLPSDYYLGDNPGIVFTLFTVLCAIMAVFIFVFARETKGRSIDDSPYFESQDSRVKVIDTPVGGGGSSAAVGGPYDVENPLRRGSNASSMGAKISRRPSIGGGARGGPVLTHASPTSSTVQN